MSAEQMRNLLLECDDWFLEIYERDRRPETTRKFFILSEKINGKTDVVSAIVILFGYDVDATIGDHCVNFVFH